MPPCVADALRPHTILGWALSTSAACRRGPDDRDEHDCTLVLGRRGVCNTLSVGGQGSYCMAAPCCACAAGTPIGRGSLQALRCYLEGATGVQGTMHSGTVG